MHRDGHDVLTTRRAPRYENAGDNGHTGERSRLALPSIPWDHTLCHLFLCHLFWSKPPGLIINVETLASPALCCPRNDAVRSDANWRDAMGPVVTKGDKPSKSGCPFG